MAACRTGNITRKHIVTPPRIELLHRLDATKVR